MRDIAKALDISIATVSRALADNPQVKPETIRRVNRAAAELGYKKDPALASLNAYREGRRQQKGFHGVIAWLTHHATQDAWREDWTSLQYFNALQPLASRLGYRVESFWLHPTDMPPGRLNQILRARGIRGILLPSLPENVDSIDFIWDSYAVVALSETILVPRVHSVQKSVFFDIRTAVEKLAELGYRKPLLAVHTRYHKGMHGIHEGAFAVATREMLGEARPVIHAPKDRLASAIHRFRNQAEVDVVLSTYTKQVLGIPAGDSTPWVSLSLQSEHGSLTGIRHEYETITRIALDHLVSMLHRGEYGLPEHPIIMRVCGVWCPGDLQVKP